MFETKNIMCAVDLSESSRVTACSPLATMSRSIPKLLIVDDDADLADILREMLEEEGFACSIASSAEEALGALRTSLDPPDFILADQWMPGMPVEELLHAVRATPAWAQTKFVLMTSGTKGDIPDASFDAIVMEPFSIEDLAATLRWPERQERAHAGTPRLSSEGPLPASRARV